MSSVELVIFDCDGVLVDSERLAVRLEVELLRDLGVQVTQAQMVHQFLGLPAEQFHMAVAQRFRLPADWHLPLADRYKVAFALELRPVDGIEYALEHIRQPIFVASNGTHAKMDYTLGITGLADYFAGRRVSAQDVPRGKPEPDIYLRAAEICGTPPARCLVIEDSPTGVHAARSAGMRVLGYSGGVTPAELLHRAN